MHPLIFTLPSHLTLVYYRFTLQAIDPLELPVNKAATLRGGFGHVFKQLACSQPWTCGAKCDLGNRCAYGYIFETSPSPDSERLSKNSDIPRPFIIQPPRDQRTTIIAGEEFSFGLVLVGYAMNYLPHFLAVFRELGHVGLGKTRGKYRLNAIEAILPYTGQVETVYHRDDPTIKMTNLVITSRMITDLATALPDDRLSVDFLTATRLKHQDKWLWDDIPFAVLVRTLLGRVSSLSYFHCGQELDVDFRGLIDQAQTVKTIRRDLEITEWSRVSGRQHQPIEMGGLIGRVTYQGDLVPYLPLLALGELVHVGKGTVFGNGQYHIVRK